MTFIQSYRAVLESMALEVEGRIGRQEPVIDVFGEPCNEIQRLRVLVNFGLTQLRGKRHPLGNKGLVQVAHHLILLSLALEAKEAEDEAAKKEVLQDAREIRATILDVMVKTASEEICQEEDKRVAAHIFEVASQFPKKPKKLAKKEPKGRTPKRKKPSK